MQLIIVSLLAWLVAQGAKFGIRAYKGDLNFRLFYQSGGMPSAHSSTVCALVVASLATYGYQSPIFGLSAVFAAIVIYDSLGVRRASGEQSLVINDIIDRLGNIKPIREVLGHTPGEVAVGGVLGIITALSFTANRWGAKAVFLTQASGASERLLYLAIFSFLAVLALAVRLRLNHYKRTETISRLKSAITLGLAPLATFGLFLSLMQYEEISGGNWRLWAVLLLLCIVTAHTFLYFYLYKHAKSSYLKQVNNLVNKYPKRKKNKKA